MIELDDSNVAYLLGRGGQTRARLGNFCGASLEISNGKAEMWGGEYQVELANLAIDITLQQRNGGKVRVSFADLEARADVVHSDVPLDAVGFVLGNKGLTLRTMETRFKTFMFFDNDKVRDHTKRLYIISPYRVRREGALKEAEDVVRYKLTGESRWQSGGGGGGGRRGGGGPPPRRRSYSRSRSRSPPRRRRSRSYSPRR